MDNGDYLVGRDEKAQIRSASGEVSRKHCAIRVQGDVIWIRDLQSRNGTYVNGEPILKETLLRPGDLITIGPLGFKVPGERTEVMIEEAEEQTEAKVSRKASAAPTDDQVADWLGEEVDPVEGDTEYISADQLPATQAKAVESQPFFEPIEPGSNAAEGARIIQAWWRTQSRS